MPAHASGRGSRGTPPENPGWRSSGNALACLPARSPCCSSPGPMLDGPAFPCPRRCRSWKPRVQLFHHFLTDEECDHIIKVRTPHRLREHRAAVRWWQSAANFNAHSTSMDPTPFHPSPTWPAPPPQIATPHIARSTVVNPDGSIGDDPIRTSWGTFLSRAHDEVVFAIEQRLANWTHLPVSHAGRWCTWFRCCCNPFWKVVPPPWCPPPVLLAL